jgi:hypothetical protein
MDHDLFAVIENLQPRDTSLADLALFIIDNVVCADSCFPFTNSVLFYTRWADAFFRTPRESK